MTGPRGFTPLMNALLCNLSILCLWQTAEYMQFGQLQHGRAGDDLAFVLYFILTYILFRKLAAAPKPGHNKNKTEEDDHDDH